MRRMIACSRLTAATFKTTWHSALRPTTVLSLVSSKVVAGLPLLSKERTAMKKSLGLTQRTFCSWKGKSHYILNKGGCGCKLRISVVNSLRELTALCNGAAFLEASVHSRSEWTTLVQSPVQRLR